MKKPIIFFDLESTGLNIVSDRIVQIGAVKIHEGKEETKDVLLHPGIPISAEAIAVHGITDEMVQGKPTFERVAKSMYDWFKGCDLGGHNCCTFDIPMLSEEFARVGITFPDDDVNIIDTLKIERLVNSHKLEACYKRYLDGTFEAHNALADSMATMAVFHSQQLNHSIPESPKELELFANDGVERIDFAGKLYRNDNGEICFAFGKSKGVPVKEDRGFANWALSKDFSTDTKNWIRKLLDEQEKA